MGHNFDDIVDRRPSGCSRWNQYDADVLAMTVADMDFPVAEPITLALQKLIDHGIFGYEWPGSDLAQLICQRMQRLYDWTVQPEEIIFLPGLRAGLLIACHAVTSPGDAAITFAPIYPPFLTTPGYFGVQSHTAPMKVIANGAVLRYENDLEAFASALTKTTKLLNFCHPHNPTGRVFTADELQHLGEICIKHNLVICSDEIHCDLLLGGVKHKPFASVSPEISDRCITLMSPSKTFNMSGLGAAYAIIQNRDLRNRFQKATEAACAEIHMPGIAAFKAAYKDCDPWLNDLLQYLTKNRDLFLDYIWKHLPGIKATVPEGTYLVWMDCRQSGIDGNPYQFFLKNARVAFSDGKIFGAGGEGFVRFNLASPRSQIMIALERMKAAMDEAESGSKR